MSPDARDPLGSITLNTTLPSSSASSSSRKPYVPPKDRPLASIFVSRRRAALPAPLPSTPESSTSRASGSSPALPTTPIASSSPDLPVRKRARLDPVEEDAWDEDGDVKPDRKRAEEVTRYFAPSTPTRAEKRLRQEEAMEVEKEEEEVKPANVWVRGRRRLGVAAYRGQVTGFESITPFHNQPSYLTTLTHSLMPFMHNTPPSSILLPSLHSPTGRPRDWSPALCVQFSHTAKLHTAVSAKDAGLRRMMAIAGEEGGIRVIDVDAPQGHHREEGGWWWRAHANAIFDVKWSGDDSRIMTASGDQTTRIHALDGSTPTLLATLRGHTSSIKSSIFYDPTRGSGDASKGSVVATAGRDGNILIYDLRCSGRRLGDGAVTDEYDARRNGRERDRYSAGIPGFTPRREGEEVDPVMVIRGAHAESGRRSNSRTLARSVTSLIALQAMPGILASGGTADGIVKLWDLRFPTPTNRHPDPRPSHSAALFLPDPTTFGAPTSRRPRGIHSLVESPTTGDLYALTGDARIHTLRPSYATLSPTPETDVFSEAILPESYASDELRTSSFFVRMSLCPDGRYLAAGSGKGGVVAFDTQARGAEKGKGVKFGLGDPAGYWPEGRTREVGAVDWGRGVMAACSDDLVTRVWRAEGGEKKEGEEWGALGAVPA